MQRPETGARQEGGAGIIGPLAFPADLSGWTTHPGGLLQVVQKSAARACGDSWLNLVSDQTIGEHSDNLLVLVAYCYLQGVYHSVDVVRRLDTDDTLAAMRHSLCVRPEQVRRFRREHRRALTDCLTHTLVTLWWDRNPGSREAAHDSFHNKLNFTFLEPFYLQAQDRIDRAVVMDSMALDY